MTTGRKGAFYRRTLVALSVVALGIVLATGTLVLRPSLTHSAEVNLRTERVVIGVEGMYCDSCAAGIKAMLKRTTGVISAEVSYKQKDAIVDFDAEQITPEKIAEAINNLGYKAKVKN